jgi:hypothetical protein
MEGKWQVKWAQINQKIWEEKQQQMKESGMEGRDWWPKSPHPIHSIGSSPSPPCSFLPQVPAVLDRLVPTCFQCLGGVVDLFLNKFICIKE